MNCCDHTCNEGHDCPVRSSMLDGSPLPLHRQVMPEETDSDSGYWLILAACGLIFLIFSLAVLVSVKPI